MSTRWNARHSVQKLHEVSHTEVGNGCVTKKSRTFDQARQTLRRLARMLAFDMRRIPVWISGVCLAVPLAWSLAACGAKEPAATPAASSTPAALPPVPRPSTPSDAACPRDGTWKPCALEDRISKAGMVAKVLDSVRVPFFKTPGTRYRIGKEARMVVFYGADSAALHTATAGLDPFRLTPRGDTIGAWPSAPREVIRSANLMAVLFDVNATQAERVRLAITAGAPLTNPSLMLAPSDTQTVRKLPPVPAR